MKVSKLIEELQKYPADANARAYEGEVCGVVVESTVDPMDPTYEVLGVIEAHESEQTRLRYTPRVDLAFTFGCA